MRHDGCREQDGAAQGGSERHDAEPAVPVEAGERDDDHRDLSQRHEGLRDGDLGAGHVQPPRDRACGGQAEREAQHHADGPTGGHPATVRLTPR